MNRDICIKIGFLIVLFVVFSQITVANDINNKSFEKVFNISVSVITTEVPDTNGTPEFEDKKPKSEIVFPSGYKINRTGIDSAIISSPGFQNKKFGIVQFYEPLGASTLEELKSRGINLYEAVDTGTLSYYSSFPANQTNYLNNSTIIKWLGLMPKEGKITNNLLNLLLSNPNETFEVYIVIFPDIDENISQSKIQELADIINYAPAPDHFYFVSSKGSNLSQILDLEFVKGISVGSKAIPNDEKSPSNSITPNMSQKTNTWKTDNFPLFAISVVVALSVLLLILLKLKRRN